MITFEKIKYKNFLSSGNHFIEIDLNKNPTTLIIGNNGSGKSTMLDVITFSLFGKSYRGINKPQLINSINEKDCVVELEFSIGTIKWKIIRGIKPSIFEIYKNGELLNQDSSSSDQQKLLEQSILKMNYKSFTQLVILGSSNFIPFMQLSAASRREVIEDLLDIKIFSSMTSIIKDQLKQLKDEIGILELKKDSLNDKVKMQENFIEELENRGRQNITQKNNQIKILTGESSSLMDDNQSLQNKLEDYEETIKKYSGATEKLRKLGNLKGKISQKISTITTEHKFFNENTVCPTCTQKIDEIFRINRIKDAQDKAKELQSGYFDLEKAIQDEEKRESQFTSFMKEITKLTHDISQNNTKISGCQRQIRDLEYEIQTIAKQLENRNTEHDKLETFKKNLSDVYDELISKKQSIDYYDFSYSLLKDGGVKTKIIKKYLPFINQQVNRYLQMMDFYINFTLDEEFNETIQSPIHEDFSYASFSEGEKSRINLALLFAWREVAKLKNSLSCNLIIFDETFDSSLDEFGADEFLKIIRYVIKDANVFVISHKELLKDKFESVIKFEKRKNFSYMV